MKPKLQVAQQGYLCSWHPRAQWITLHQEGHFQRRRYDPNTPGLAALGMLARGLRRDVDPRVGDEKVFENLQRRMLAAYNVPSSNAQY
jgi:hypothetical protein